MAPSGSGRPESKSGSKSIEARGEAVVLAADSLDAPTSIGETKKTVPHTEKVDGSGSNLTRKFLAYSVSALKLTTR